MSKSTYLDESATGALNPITGKTRWKARIIGVGKGSKAHYTQEAIESAVAAFPVGTKVNADHASWREKDDRPEGSVKTMIGVVATEPVAESDGAYAEIEFIDEWAPKIEQIAPYVGLSIHAQAMWDTEADDGLPVVNTFVPNPLNTVDVVTVAGAKGALLEVMESLDCDIMGSVTENERIDRGMKPEDIAAIVAGITEALKPEPVEESETETPDLSTVTEAIIASELPDVARKQVFAAIESGVDVEEAIKAQKDYVDALAKTLDVEESGAKRKMDSHKADESDYSVGAWG